MSDEQLDPPFKDILFLFLQKMKGCIYDAIISDDVVLMEQLMLEHHMDVNHIDGDGWTCIMEAASAKSSKCLQKLIDMKGDPNREAATGDTALMIAISNDDTASCVQLLLTAKADTSQQSAFSYFPLNWAVRHENRDAVSLLIRHGCLERKEYGPHPLVTAHGYVCPHAAEVLIDSGKVRLEGVFRETPKWIARLFKKRQHAKDAFKTLYGVFRKRMLSDVKFPLDMVRMISSCLWDTRFLNDWDY